MEGYFECVLHHGGQFGNFDPSDYNGDVSTWSCDPDRWSYFEVLGILKDMGYLNVINLWYNDPSEGLKLLIDDKGSVEMTQIAKVHGNVHLFVLHPLSQPDIIEGPKESNGLELIKVTDDVAGPADVVGPTDVNGPHEHEGGVHTGPTDVNGPQHAGGVHTGPTNVNGPQAHEGGVQADVGLNGTQVHEVGVHIEDVLEKVPEKHAEEVPEIHVAAEEVPEKHVAAEEVPEKHAEEVPEIHVAAEEVPEKHVAAEEVPVEEVAAEEVPNEEGMPPETDSEDSAKGIHFDDSEEELDDEDLFEQQIAKPIEPQENSSKTKKGKTVASNSVVSAEKSKNKKRRGRPRKTRDKVVEHENVSEHSEAESLFEGGNEEIQVRVRGLSDSDYTSEELQSGGETDEEEGQPSIKHPKFKLPSKMIDYKWELGTLFVSKEEFKEAIRTYAVHSGRNLKFKKNDLRRMRVICKSGCGWQAYCAKIPGEDTWQLRKIVDKHTCSREFKVKLLSSNWLSKKLHTNVRENPKLKLTDIMEKTQKKWNSGISKTKALRARTAAIDLVDGSFREQYTRMYDYCHELLRSNAGSTVKVTMQPFQCDEEDLQHPERPLCPHFQRLYICFSGCRDSFLKCRPIIGLDGCFLKGYYGGQLLAAIGRDPNDQMLPIAFAVVEGETKESWTWFMELLINDLGGTNVCSKYTFISDQQKGLLPTMQELLPEVDQRFCVRHLYSNFRKKHAGQQLKQMMWRAAKSTYPQAWEREMKEMRKVNEEAFKWLWQMPPRFWSKSWFKPAPKCDTLLNNMSEAFNSVIVAARSKPIVTMLEEIRVYLMERWESNRTKIANYSGSILPRIKKRLERESDYTNQWMPRCAGQEYYEVKHITNTGDKFVVNLQTKECSCRKWMLTGIPCCHAISCMRHMDLNPEDYVPSYFRKEAYEACYQSIIYPANGHNLWPKTEFTDLQPPPIKRQPGRPKKRRNKEAGELKKDDASLRRVGLHQRCSRCHQHGHNKSRCPIPPPVPKNATEASTHAAAPEASTNAAVAPEASTQSATAPQASSQPAPQATASQAPTQASPATASQTACSNPVEATGSIGRGKRKVAKQPATQSAASKPSKKSRVQPAVTQPSIRPKLSIRRPTQPWKI